MRNLRQNDPIVKRIKAFLDRQATYNNRIITISDILEIRDGEYIVNCYGEFINSSSLSNFFYHVGSLSGPEGGYYVKNSYPDAKFNSINETLGDINFFWEQVPPHFKKILYSFKSGIPELFSFTEIENFGFAPAYGFNVARVTISVSYCRDLVFLIDESGDIVSPICDTKMPYAKDDIDGSYINLKNRQALAKFVASIVSEEQAAQRAVDCAKARLYKKAPTSSDNE